MSDEGRATFDQTLEQHALGFPDCAREDAHEHVLPLSTFRVVNPATTTEHAWDGNGVCQIHGRYCSFVGGAS